MVICPWRRSWYGGLWNKETRERNTEPNMIEANASWAPWAYGWLAGPRREGTILVQQRCQWSTAKAGVTSVLWLRDATNAHLSMKHDVAKQAANEMARKEVNKFFLRPAHFPCGCDHFRRRRRNRHSGEIRYMAWGRLCSAYFFVKATCSPFQPELEILETKRKPHALRVEKCPITGPSTSLGTTGYVHDFACHLLGAWCVERAEREP